MQGWGWNAELWVCQAGTLPTERQTQPLLLACHHSNLETGLRAWPVFLLGSLFALAESINEQTPLTFTGQNAELQLPERRTVSQPNRDPRATLTPAAAPRLWAPQAPRARVTGNFQGRSVLILMKGSAALMAGRARVQGGRSRPSRSRAPLAGGRLACVIYQEFLFSPPRGWKKKQ